MVTVTSPRIHGYSHYLNDRWRSDDRGWHRGWNRARDHQDPGLAGRSRGAAPVGSGNAYIGWLGAHGNYR
jgi:hypothetical protein